MHQHGMIHGHDRATWLAAVSGGSYLAGGMAMVTAAPQITAKDDPHFQRVNDVGAPGVDSPAFGVGSPEESLLRNRTRYLSHGSGGPLAMMWRYLLGVGVSVLIVGLAVYAIFLPVGWVYGWRIPELRNVAGNAANLHHFDAPQWLVWTITGLVAASVISGFLWVVARWRTRHLNGIFAGSSAVLVGAAFALWVVAVGVPHVLDFVRVTLPRHGVGLSTPKRGGGAVASAAQKNLAGGTVIGAILSLLGGAGALKAGTATPPIVQNAEKSVQRVAVSTATRLATRFRGPLLNLAAAISGPFLVVCGALLAIVFGASRPVLTSHVGILVAAALWIPAVVVLALFYLLGDLNVWSLHPFYRRRLVAAYAPRRLKADDGRSQSSPNAVNGVDVEPFPRGGFDVKLADFIGPTGKAADFPELLICASANIADYGETPTGSNVTSFVFSRREMGGPVIGSLPTAEYASRVDRRTDELTVPSAVAIAGAAFSPAMGKMTRAPLRFVLSLLNLRLGVWLPNPRWVATRDSNDRIRTRPHLWCLLREMVGRMRLNGRFLYLTDGGHYENLGLVELLRRRCEWIWCIDASGDSIDSFNTIGQALALADAELGVRIDLHPEQMAPDPETSAKRASQGKPPLVTRAHCQARFTYPGGTGGQLVVIKAGVWAEAPWEVQSFYERNPRFPCDPTTNQLYTAERFDAYRALGAAAMKAAWADVAKDFSRFRFGGHLPRLP